MNKAEIENIVNRKFSKYISHFELEISTVHQRRPVMWKYDISFTSQIDGLDQSFSDGIEPGNVNGIIERVWLSILASANNSTFKNKQFIVEDIEKVGESLGFITPANKNR